MSNCNNCIDCYFGANKMGYRGSLYKFKKIIKKRNNEVIIINYENNEFGCRKSKWNDKENICLNNNFSEFKEFKIV